MLSKLAELAGELDKRGYTNQADLVDDLVCKLATDKEFISLCQKLVVAEKEKGACEMCGEYEKLSKAEMNDTGEPAMLCKDCKKQYAK